MGESQTGGSKCTSYNFFFQFFWFCDKIHNITVINCSRICHRWDERHLRQKVCGPWYVTFKHLRHSNGIGHLKPVAFSGSKLILLFHYKELVASIFSSPRRHLETVENGTVRSFFALPRPLTFCCLIKSKPYLNYSGKYACPWRWWQCLDVCL